ncbi:magnesium transporter CorA family protein [Candidatus Woesearchaeota archaeon]|nr:magnesium transporter CorA family protein [Candidatus Woesearchaeota archaeon]
MLKYMLTGDGLVTKNDKPDYRLPRKGEILWIFLIEPTSEEISKATKDLKIEKKPFDLFSKEKHSVRYSMDPFQFVIVDYFIENGRVDHAHLLFTIKDNILLLVSNRNARYFHDLFEDITSNIKNNRIRVKGIGNVLNLFLQFDIEENYDVLEKTEEEIRLIEERVANYEKSMSINGKDIIKFKRKLFLMGRRFWASTKIIFLLKAGFTNVKLDKETSKLLVDVHDTFLHQIDLVTAQKEMLSDLMNVYSTSINNKLATISNELNQTMKTLSSFALIMLLPTLIASIYGMNFEHMPFLKSQYGFFIAVISMILTVFALVYFFRKKSWL